MKAVAVFDRRASAWLSEKLIDDGTIDCQLLDVEEFLLDIEKFDACLYRRDGAKLDVLLLDSCLPAAFLSKIVLRAKEKAPALPVLLLPQLQAQLTHASGLLDGLAPPAVASDVSKVVRYARSRERLQRKLLHAALKDDLTGLYNRRGFRELVKQQVRLARNMKQHLLLFFADLDGLKKINDRLGHHIGDEAIVQAASVIKRSFRKSDICARFGGDEFVALVMEEPRRSGEQIRRRLLNNLHKHASREKRYSLSLSVGMARIDPNTRAPLQQVLMNLMTQADAAMYSHKRTTKATKPRLRVPGAAPAALPKIKTARLNKRPVRGRIDGTGTETWRPVLAERSVGTPP